ncbi:phage tail protein [Isoptericola variabilis]|uniref:phage tail protein n=1 Tax=Isoptericola variabilis TaxID=139208 RepID=UPI003D248F92
MATPAVEFTVVGVDKASKTFDDVGRSASDSADKISRASEEAGSKFDAAGESAGDLATWTATLGDGMATLGEQIGGPAGRFLEMGGNAILAGTAIGDLGEGAVQAGKWIKGLGIVQKAQAAASWVATAAQKALNVAMKANPIGLIITGITLLVGALVWFFTKTELGRKIVAAAWKGIQVAIEAVGKWFKGTLVPWFKAAIDRITGFFSNAKKNISDRWNALVDWFKNIPNRIGSAVSTVATKVREKFSTARDRVKEVFNNVVDWFKNLPAQFGSALAGLGTAVWNRADAARTRVKDVFNNVVDWFRNIPSRIGSAVGAVGSFVYEKFSAARTRVKDVFNNLVSWFRNLPSRFGSALGGLGSSIGGVFKSAFNNVASWWNNSIGRIGFTVPSWVPKVGGRSFDVPNIPYLASGGTIARGGWAVVGEEGPELAHLPANTTVFPNGTAPAPAGGPVLHIENFYAESQAVGALADELAWKIRR